MDLHCRFYLKTGSDVQAPLYKTNCRPHTLIPPTHELSQSHFSRFTLTYQEIHSLYVIWSWLICCLLQYSIYIHLIYIYIHVSLHSTFIYIFLFLVFDLYLIMLPHFTWKNFLCIYFMFIFFLNFIDQVV